MDDVSSILHSALSGIRHRQRNIYLPQQSFKIMFREELLQHNNLKYRQRQFCLSLA